MTRLFASVIVIRPLSTQWYRSCQAMLDLCRIGHLLALPCSSYHPTDRDFNLGSPN
jgi:hypothetical protein